MPKWLDKYEEPGKTITVKTDRERRNCRNSLWAKGIKVTSRKRGKTFIIFKGNAPYGYRRK